VIAAFAMLVSAVARGSSSAGQLVARRGPPEIGV
jgi:hypothetical protein